MTDTLDNAPTRALAAFAATLIPQQVPPEVIDKAKALLLDYVGHTVAAAGEDPAQRLMRFVAAMGGAPQARIIGSTLRVPAPWAALVNGAMGHMAELDDTHRGTMSHPGDTMWAAALAVGESVGASGLDTLVAAIAGYEVALRIGQAVMPDHYRRGWHTSGTLMVFGAAATAARLLGLDATQTAWALGTAGAQASGNFAHLPERAMTKDFNCGHAAKSGVIAALLAREGFTGPTNVLESPRGFMALYGGQTQPALLTEGLGQSWRILEVAHKPYSACRHIHAAIDALLALRAQAGFGAAEVESVVARIFRTGAWFVDDPVPWEGDKGLQGARFSTQFNLAVALQDGPAGIASLLDSRCANAYLASDELRRLMKRVSVVHDAELDRSFPDQWSSIAEVTLKDGRRLSQRVDYPLGEPENPVSDAMLDDKFSRLTALVGWPAERAGKAISAVRRIDREARLDGLLQQL